MLTILICVFLFVVYCWAAIPYIRGQRNAADCATTGSAENQALNRALQARSKRLPLVSLIGLSQELEGTIFSLRLAVGQVASLLVENLDFETIKMLEERLCHALPPAADMSPAALSAAAARLEFCLASCQTVSAMIEAGPLEPFDRSPADSRFVSLLSRTKKQLSVLPFLMLGERRIIKDTEGDLASAQQWMEIATLVIRRLPLQSRFAGLQASR